MRKRNNSQGPKGGGIPRLFRAWRLYIRSRDALRDQSTTESAAGRADAVYGIFGRIVNTFRALVESEKTHLIGLLVKADRQFAPFSDPFRLPMSGHRWLDLGREREESYSDWLAWIVERMDSAEQVLRLFGLEQTEFADRVRRSKPKLSREESFPATGGEMKRLDIVVRFGDVGILLVEVKVRGLDVAGGLDNLPDYYTWLEGCQADPARRCALFLVPPAELIRCEDFLEGAQPMESPCSGWEVRSWESVSLMLRCRARESIVSHPEELLFAAMLICFAGAVEQNVLGFDGSGKTISTPQTALYLERFLQGGRS